MGPEDSARHYIHQLGRVRRTSIHYTPKHGGLLNTAETELERIASRCLDWRLPDIDTLTSEFAAWEDTLTDPVQVVQDFIDAINARDVNRVVGCFGVGAVMQNDAGHVFAQGEQGIRAHFGTFLPQSPCRHSEILSRIHVGPWVVQEEPVTGLVLGEPVPEFSIPAAYRVEDGKIVKCIGLQ